MKRWIKNKKGIIMKMKAFVLILTAFTSLNIMASDPSISVYKSTTVTKDKDDSGNIKKDADGIEMMTIDGGQENINREIRFFHSLKLIQYLVV
jgi:hypothetical protein